MRPQAWPGEKASNATASYGLQDSSLLSKLDTASSIRGLDQLLMVQVLDCATNFVDSAHEIVIARTNKQFCSRFELARCLPGIRKNKPLDATAELVDPIEKVWTRSGLDKIREHAGHTPSGACRVQGVDLLCNHPCALQLRALNW